MDSEQSTPSLPHTPDELVYKKPYSYRLPRKPLAPDAYSLFNKQEFAHSPETTLQDHQNLLPDPFRDGSATSTNSRGPFNGLGISHYRAVSDTQVPLISQTNITPSKESIKRWPSEPQPIKKRSTSRKLYTMGDIILTCLPLIFLVLAICAGRLNGTRVDNNPFGAKVVRASKLGPTLFPIVFAAVAGRTAQVLVRFYAGRGTKLGILEMLLSSQTVWGTIESQVLLRHLSIVGAHVLLLWMMSPMGGQAALYVLNTRIATNQTTALVRYLDTWRDAPGDMFGFAANGRGSIYTACLLASDDVRDGPRDTWGNIKIPRPDTLSADHTDGNDGWLVVPELTSVENYTSMVGIPFVGLQDGASTFTMETSYLSLACAQPDLRNIHDHSWFNDLGTGWKGSGNTLTIPQSRVNNKNWIPFFFDSNTFSDMSPRMQMVQFGEIQAMMGMNQSYIKENLAMATNALFGSRSMIAYKSDNIVLINCSVTQEYVQSTVLCPSSQECRVEKMRKSLLDHRSSQLTPLDAEYNFRVFGRDFPTASGDPFMLDSTSAERFLLDTTKLPFNVDGQGQSEPSTVNLSVVPADVIANRLTILVNTYYQASINFPAFTGHLSTNLSIYGPEVWPLHGFGDIDEATVMNAPMISKASNATLTRAFEVYNVRRGWLFVLIVSSSVLVITGVVGLFLKVQVVVPDMFGYVSSMTYHNPHVSLPPGFGPLDGMERARALSNMKVMVADVRADEDIGHLALISLPNMDTEVGKSNSPGIAKLNKRRSYY